MLLPKTLPANSRTEATIMTYNSGDRPKRNKKQIIRPLCALDKWCDFKQKVSRNYGHLKHPRCLFKGTCNQQRFLYD